MQDNNSIETLSNMAIQFCHNNSIIIPKSMENPKDIDEVENFAQMFDCAKAANENTSDLDEFDQVLSKYREEQVSDHSTQFNTTYKSNSLETFLDISMDIAEHGNKTKNFNDPYEEHFLNNANVRNNELIKPESLDVISFNSEESLNIFESDRSVDLDDISLASNNIIFTNFEKSNENRSFEIEIDFNKITESPNEVNNINFDANSFHNAIDNFANESSQNALNNTNDVDINSECSFHSSDFEFISEEEAKMDSLIIHFRRNGNEDNYVPHNDDFIEMYLPGANDEFTSRENHKIPEGEEFFNLFRGIYAPAMVPDIFLENKSVIPSQCMSVEKEALGFDMKILNKDYIVDDKHQEEAKETAKKILETLDY